MSGTDLIREITNWRSIDHRSSGHLIDKKEITLARIRVEAGNGDILQITRDDAELKAIHDLGLAERDREIIKNGGTIIIDIGGHKVY